MIANKIDGLLVLTDVLTKTDCCDYEVNRDRNQAVSDCSSKSIPPGNPVKKRKKKKKTTLKILR